MRKRLLVLAVTALLVGASQADDLPAHARCDLAQPKWEQAKCLLARVQRYGVLGPRLSHLPEPFGALLTSDGKPPSVDTFKAYLSRTGVAESEVGGDLAVGLSRNRSGTTARYFVIHDTSTPLLDGPLDDLPEQGPWGSSRLELVQKLARRRNAHVFIGRHGESVTAVDLASPVVTTKFEQKHRDTMEGLCLGIENVQPRRLDAAGVDSIAPLPGFSDPQMLRLAVVYVASSVRAGEWLIPAFHAVMDAGIRGGHDDPQNFDLTRFASAVQAVLGQL